MSAGWGVFARRAFLANKYRETAEQIWRDANFVLYSRDFVLYSRDFVITGFYYNINYRAGLEIKFFIVDILLLKGSLNRGFSVFLISDVTRVV
jgi:hypothetical protein